MIMCLQNKKTDHHRVVRFFQCRIITAKKLCQLDHIVIALTHLLPVYRDHIVMDPVTGGVFMITDRALCYFTFMVRKLKIHTATMNIKLVAKIFTTHGGAFYMPAGKSFTPGAWPS